MKRVWVVSLLACFALLDLHCSRNAEIPAMRDKENRIVVYHGLNLCNYSKTAPDRLPWQTKEDFARLLHEGVIVRPMKLYAFPTSFRVTIGTHPENEQFLESLRRVMSAPVRAAH